MTSVRGESEADEPSGVAAEGLTGLQVESWRLLWRELADDREAMADYRAWAARRDVARPQMLALLERFLAGRADLEAFRSTLDANTRTHWDVFGLRGASGAMYLNRLAKHVDDRDALADRLRAVLPAPDDVDDARRRLRAFAGWLDGLARRGEVDTLHVQPARAVFFVTSWWSAQDAERWPSFQQSARQVLEREEGVYQPTGHAIDDYVIFRRALLTLAVTLRVTPTELEYLCWWHVHRTGAIEADEEPAPRRGPARLALPRAVRERRPTTRAEPRTRSARAESGHTHVQWLLATIGRKLGCRVWIAANDRGKSWEGESLGALSLRKLPSLGLDPDSQRVVSLIDVVWLKGANQVAAAFEIEHTTSIYSGLLRMADLAALAPNLNFPLYIVAPEARLEKVRRELSRPTFRTLDLHRRCAYFSSEALADSAEHILRWGHNATAIERLARRVGDPEEGERAG